MVRFSAEIWPPGRHPGPADSTSDVPCMAEVDHQTSDLRMKIEGLQGSIQELEGKLGMAGQYGKELLQNNQFLNQQLDEFASKLQALEQENYTIQMRLEGKVKNEEDLSAEVETLRECIQNLERKVQQMETDFAKKESDYKSRLIAAEQANEMLNHEKQRLAGKIGHMEAQAAALEQVAREQRAADHEKSFSDDVSELQSEVSALNQENASLRSELALQIREMEDLREMLLSWQEKHSSLKQGLLESEEEVAAYHVNIESLRSQLALLQAQKESENDVTCTPTKKGNSLFGELEDRRVKAESACRSLEQRCKDLERQNKHKADQLLQTRLQMAAMLGQAADRSKSNEYIQHLESELATVRRRIKELEESSKRDSEEEDVTLVPFANDSIAVHKGEHNLAYMEALIHHERAEKEKAQTTLRQQMVHQFAESEKLLCARKQLHEQERQIQALKAENLKLALQVPHDDKKKVLKPKENMARKLPEIKVPKREERRKSPEKITRRQTVNECKQQ